MRLAKAVVALALLLRAGTSLADEPINFATSFAHRSEVLGEERTILVATPRGYEGGKLRYPVLYVTDGETQFLHTVASAEFLARNGRISPLVVVGVTNGRGMRTRDLTPTSATFTDSKDRTPVPGSGGADRFLKFLETELVPKIDGTYRTLPFRLLAGHSFGGLFALHALARRPDLFGGVIAASPSLHFDDDLPFRELKSLFASRKELRATLYATLGSEGPVVKKSLDRLRDLLKKEKPAEFSWETRELLEDDHGSVVLKTYYEGLLKVFEGWALPRDPATGGFTGGLPGVKAHYAGLSKRFGTTIAPPEVAVNNAGYAELAAKRVDRALEAFRYNVERYPESANTYDSLGDGLEASGDLAAARDSFARAVEVAKKSADPLLPTFQQHLDEADAKLKARAPR